jgi:hypothetical protein
MGAGLRLKWATDWMREGRPLAVPRKFSAPPRMLRAVAEEYSVGRLRQGRDPGPYWLSCRVRRSAESVIHPDSMNVTR